MTEPKERPILFSGEMVRAILAGRKTQTRRVTTARGADRVRYVENAMQVPQRAGDKPFSGWVAEVDKLGGATGLHLPLACPYGAAGDTLWVRETLQKGAKEIKGYDYLSRTIQYAADCTPVPYADGAKLGYCGFAVWQWKRKVIPSIHMPRWASRLTLEIVSVRVERLQDISADDAKAEGVEPNWAGELSGWSAEEHGYMPYGYGEEDEDMPAICTARESFELLWDIINGKRAPWASNPFVWVVKFKKL